MGVPNCCYQMGLTNRNRTRRVGASILVAILRQPSDAGTNFFFLGGLSIAVERPN